MLAVFGTPDHVIGGPDPVKLMSERVSCQYDIDCSLSNVITDLYVVFDHTFLKNH